MKPAPCRCGHQPGRHFTEYCAGICPCRVYIPAAAPEATCTVSDAEHDFTLGRFGACTGCPANAEPLDTSTTLTHGPPAELAARKHSRTPPPETTPP